MEQIFNELEKLITNAKKSKIRKYTVDTIQEKLRYIEQLGKNFETLVGHLPNPSRNENIIKFKNLKESAFQILMEHKEDIIMSNFNSKQASDTIPTFDGRPKHLDMFLSMVEMVSDELNAQGKANLIKFVIAMKLSDRVRDILMLENIPTTYDELRTCLTKNFKPTRTASSLHSGIRDMEQRGNVLNYRDKLSSLIAELTLLQVSELGESPNEVARSTIKMMNEKLALETFQKGLHENIRIAVIAAQPKSLTQAYDIASTQEQSLQSSNAANLFYTNRSQYKNNKNNYQNHNHKKANKLLNEP